MSHPLPRVFASRSCMAELWSFAHVVLRTALPTDHCGSAVDGRVESPYQRVRDASMILTTTTISWGPQHGRVRTIPSVARQGCPTRLSRSWRCIGAFSVLGARAAKSTARRGAPRGAQSGRRLKGHEFQRMGIQLCAKATKPHSLSQRLARRLKVAEQLSKVESVGGGAS